MLETFQINANCSLYYIPMKRLKTTTLGIYIHRALNAEEASMNALLPYVLKRGSRLLKTSADMAKYLENLYGASCSVGVVKKGEDQILCFDAESISDRYAPNHEPLTRRLLELFMSMLFEPLVENDGFLPSYVEQEKKNAIDRIQGLINDKRTYAQIRCLREMCEGKAAAISKLGTVEGIEKITPQSLYTYYKKLLRESRIEIFVCGDANISEIQSALSVFPSPAATAAVPRCGIFTREGELKRVTDHLDVTQGKLSLGFRTNISSDDPDFWGLMVGNSIFGSGAHSKLFNNVREKLSLCYYASSQLERFLGLLFVNAGIEFQNFQKAYDEILVQLRAVQSGDISDFEFSSSVNALLNSYESLYDDQRYMQSFYLGEQLAGTNYEISDYINRIKKVTKEDVVRAMNRISLDTVYFLTGKEDAACK